MFEHAEKQYELKFNIGRLKLIEKAGDGKGVLVQLASGDNGLMSIDALERFFSYGLKEAGADTFLPPKKAAEICDEIIAEEGYAQAVKLVQEQVMKDCPFLFRVA